MVKCIQIPHKKENTYTKDHGTACEKEHIYLDRFAHSHLSVIYAHGTLFFLRYSVGTSYICRLHEGADHPIVGRYFEDLLFPPLNEIRAKKRLALQHDTIWIFSSFRNFYEKPSS